MRGYNQLFLYQSYSYRIGNIYLSWKITVEESNSLEIAQRFKEEIERVEDIYVNTLRLIHENLVVPLYQPNSENPILNANQFSIFRNVEIFLQNHLSLLQLIQLSAVPPSPAVRSSASPVPSFSFLPFFSFLVFLFPSHLPPGRPFTRFIQYHRKRRNYLALRSISAILMNSGAIIWCFQQS